MVSLSHLLVHRLFLKYGPEKESFFIVLDYGFSLLILGGFTAYVFRRLRRKPYFTRLELFLVPLLGLCMPLSGNRLFLYAAVLLTYTMIFRERKFLQTA